MIPTDAPAADELEVSVFGPGFGEAICVHIGQGRWVLVDSCFDPRTGEPASLGYLSELKVDLKKQVVLVVVTHWDDDHIGGIGRVAAECESASITCSSALLQEDILQFVLETEGDGGALGSGLDELRTLLRLPDARKRIIWAKANTPLLPRPPGDAPEVVALSPSEDAFERSIESLAVAATGRRPAIRRRYRAPEGPNGASVAITIKSPPDSILLGADLENTNETKNPETGWQAVMTYARPTTKASLFKVPHHASDGAHDDDVWTDLVVDAVPAIVTPWALGAHFLPTEPDLVRLRALTENLYLTAMPALKRIDKDREVNRLISRLHPNRVKQLRGWGQVRARRRVGDTAWSVELDGDAVQIDAP